jgi:hypothetical protein
MAEIELSALSKQCLDRRIGDIDTPHIPMQEPSCIVFFHSSNMSPRPGS